MSNLDGPDWSRGAQVGSNECLNSGLVSAVNGAVAVLGTAYVGNQDGVLILATGIGAGNWKWQLLWDTQAAGGANPIATPAWFQNTAGVTLFTSPVMGPYLKVQATNNTGATNSVSCVVVGVAGGGVVKEVLQPRVVIDQQGVTVPHFSSASYQSVIPSPGVYRVWAQSNQNGFLNMQVWNGATWDTFYAAQLAASPGINFEIACPIDEWRVQLTDSATTDATATLAVTGPY